MSLQAGAGYPPAHVTFLLRIEGAAIFLAAVAAFHLTGANWWLFALLILAPDLAFLASLAGEKAGARAYNIAHTYTAPLVLGPLAWLIGGTWALPVALIWIAHIGADRALGYGLKYDRFHDTHLGPIGKSRKTASRADEP